VINVVVLGIPETIARFAKVAVGGQAAGVATATGGGAIVQAEMQATAPVNTGALRDSIGILEQSVSIGEASVSIGAAIDYDRYVQLGTSKMSGQPYAQAAGEAAEDAIFGIAVTAINAVI
jgi:HK97 gp10 family phage protein